jgi:hypothetical protein
MGKANVFVAPNIGGIGASVLLERIHSVEDGVIGMAEHAPNTAHVLSTRDPFLKRCSVSS